ncbi:MAG: PDZ domain-containing protein [Clostridia bacterium]|nr:PDZ domain-containing protein [Clostridia bacterium]
MATIVNLMRYIMYSFVSAIVNPMFILVIFIIYGMYKRDQQLEEKVLGKVRVTLESKLFNDVLYGILFGLVGSFIAVIMGISIDSTSIMYILPIALLMLLISPRYVCFAYAGGIVAISNLLFGFPKIHVPSIIALVGLLHLIESMLIMADGSTGSIPVFIEHDEYGVVGAFMMRKFWPIPIILLTITASVQTGDVVSMPDWWPLIKPSIDSSASQPIFVMIPVIAALGYSDMAVIDLPKRCSRFSGMLLLLYSVCLLTLSVIAQDSTALQYLAAVATPLGHELLIFTGNRRQKNNRPIFKSPDIGVMILDVLPGYPGEDMGILPGDIVSAINGKQVNSEEMIREVLNDFPRYVWLDVKGIDGSIRTCEYKKYPDGVDNLGIIIIPKYSRNIYKISEFKGPLTRKIESLFRNRDFDA